MPGNPLHSGRLRGFLRRIARRAKRIFKPSAQASTPYTPSPSSGARHNEPLPQPAPSQQPVPTQILHSPTQSQQLAILDQATPSASRPTTPNQLANTESKLSEAAKKAGADAWTGLKLALRLVKESSDVCTPLKSAVGGFLGVVDIFETAAQNRNDYAEIATNLQGMINEFKERPGEYTSSKMSEALRAMTSGLREEMEHIQEQREHSKFRRHLEADKDLDDVQGCYRRVETLCRELQNRTLVEVSSNQEEQKVDACLKELNAALKAMYNSKMSAVIGRRKCTPGTRESILAEMRKWASDLQGPKVYWLNGMAGTGKTTLAYSFCAEMQAERRLGASFFCSRTDADSRDVSRIIPTIAHQLARLLPSYRKVLVQQIGEYKDIGALETETQFEKLIRAPLHEIQDSVPEGIVITIDALDECDRRDGAQDILNILFLHARDLPIRFFVTCRPEPGLFDALQSQDKHCCSVLHLHDIEASFVQVDIRTYLEIELSETSLPTEKVGQLAEQAGTLFIYAATAVRYIRPKSRQVDFHQRLESLLSIASKTKTKKHKGIDDLYTAVLAAPFTDEELDFQEKENIRLVLNTAICAREPLSVATMAKLLEFNGEQDVMHALQHLRSVLHVSPGTYLISTLHASFPDFMLSPERSEALCCDVTKHNQFLALSCFKSMERLLKFNICNLQSSFVLDKNIPDLADTIDKSISPELFYACRYWGDHLGLAVTLDDVHSALDEFLSNQLLFWMEVLNLRNCIDSGARILTHIHAWLRKLGGTDNALELTLDAGRFVTAFGLSSASRSTPHIYISALAFWPQTRPVRLRYEKYTRNVVSLEGTAIERRDMSCLATWNTTSNICCVAFSPDGSRIVSGSGDGTIRVRDARSGLNVAGPFKGHTASVNSVAYSHDGTRIVSGSCDNTIWVWDARSGVAVGKPFEGHTAQVTSVAFSSDGTRIVSGSYDNTVCVWDACSGLALYGLFEGHTGGVHSVAFSPDGTLIASGSKDCTVCIWDAHSGLVVGGPFKGHTDLVTSVAFSPNGTHIVSGSGDNTIRVWDVCSGLIVGGAFEGHTDRVTSVAFSLDGTRIVSGSWDRTIRSWDAGSGLIVAGPFEGHGGRVFSVALSPDGTRVVSGSWDLTIRVWDAHSGLVISELLDGHAGPIYSIAFSSDGSLVVSGSYDKTIRVWDARSGLMVAGPFENAANVMSVAFSPDSTRIISGDYDGTILVRDARSGLVVVGPFEGHTNVIMSVVFSPDGARIVSGSVDSTIRVWDARSGDLVAGPFEGHTSAVTSASFSVDGTRIVSGSYDETICIWDAHNGDLVSGPFEGHTKPVVSVAFSPDSTRIVSGSHDKTIRVWDAHSGDLVAGPFKGHTNAVYSVAFSPDSHRIVSGSWDSTICVWDVLSGLIVGEPFEGHTSGVHTVAFSRDGTRIVSGAHDNTIRIWNAPPLYERDPDPLVDWLMDRDGMVTTRSGQLIVCVPAGFHSGLMRPRSTVVIGAKGYLTLEFDKGFLDSSWVEHYQ